jgi:hypothetical protein
MDYEDKTRREKLIKYIKANSPFYMDSCFDLFDLEVLEKIKMDIDEEIKMERSARLKIALN